MSIVALPDSSDVVSNDVVLLVNGVLYGGWLKLSIGAGINRFARDFSFAVTREWPDGLGALKDIREGDLVEVRIGADVVMTGYVDATPIRYDSDSVTVGVEGRSKTGDLIDCSALNKPAQWKGATAAKIISDLAGEYGVTVQEDFADQQIIKEFQFTRGDSVFDCIDKLRKQRNLLITDNGAGQVVIAKIGATRASDALTLGQNVVSASCPKDFKEVYNEYVVIGQKSNDGQAKVRETNTAQTQKSEVFKRKRVLYVKQSGNADVRSCADRAKYEQQCRFAKAHEVDLTVRGWRQSDGTLWAPNMIVPYNDPVIGLAREMLIVECDYAVDNGQVVYMKIGLPDGYSSEPYVPEKDKSAKKSKGVTGAKGGASAGHISTKARKGRAQGGGAWSDVVGNDEVDE